MTDNIIQIAAGALGGLGFSVVFGIRKKYMILVALNAGLSWAVSIWKAVSIWSLN